MIAADQHEEEANAQRDEAENPDVGGANAANSVPVVGEFDLSAFAVELEEVAGGASGSEAEDAEDDDDGATAHGADPPGMAEQDSDEDFLERPRGPRSRYIDDEAEDF